MEIFIKVELEAKISIVKKKHKLTNWINNNKNKMLNNKFNIILSTNEIL